MNTKPLGTIHRAYIDFIGGQFEGRYYDRDEGRTYRWTSHRCADVRQKLEKHLEGCGFLITMTEQAQTAG